MGITTVIVGPQAPAQDPRASGIKFGQLNRKHKSYDAKLTDKLKLLVEGGWEIQKRAAELIPKAPNEPEELYKWRLNFTSYINKLAQTKGYLLGQLFHTPVAVQPAKPEGASETPEPPNPDFYKAFAADCDMKRTDFSQFMRRATDIALIHRRVVIGVDMPRAPEGATNLADEEKAGGGEAYLYALDPAELINWETIEPATVTRRRERTGKLRNSVRGFKWCVIKRMYCDRSSPFGPEEEIPEFKVWEVDENGRGMFTVYQPVVKPSDRPNGYLDTDDMMIVDRGTTSFPRIPLILFELPTALVLGDQAGPLCLEHFRRRSDLAGSMVRSLVEIPFIKRGSEVGAPMGILPSTTQQDENRGADPVGQFKSRGYVPIGAGDELGFVGPSGTAFNIAREEIATLGEEIHKITVTMGLAIENTAAALQRSGESKSSDKAETLVVLFYLAAEVRECCEEVYETVTHGRLDAETEWAASGLDSYTQENASDVVAEAVDIKALAIPSNTFMAKYWERIVRVVLPDLTEDEQKQIVKELTDGIEAAHELNEAMQGAAIRGANASPEVPVGGVKPPKTPKLPAASAGAAE